MCRKIQQLVGAAEQQCTAPHRTGKQPCVSRKPSATSRGGVRYRVNAKNRVECVCERERARVVVSPAQYLLVCWGGWPHQHKRERLLIHITHNQPRNRYELMTHTGNGVYVEQ